VSQTNVELARRAFEAVNSVRNRDGALRWLNEFCDPDVEWDFSRRGLDGAIYHGYEGWLSFAEQFRGVWQEFQREVQEIFDAGTAMAAAGVAMRTLREWTTSRPGDDATLRGPCAEWAGG
jgi:hypothetical protein